MTAPAPVFLIMNGDGSGFPMYRTTDGTIALMWFRSSENAQRFIDGKGKIAEWTVQEMPQPDAVKWLQDAARVNLATDLLIDPEADHDAKNPNSRVVPIVIFLSQLQ